MSLTRAKNCKDHVSFSIYSTQLYPTREEKEYPCFSDFPHPKGRGFQL